MADRVNILSCACRLFPNFVQRTCVYTSACRAWGKYPRRKHR